MGKVEIKEAVSDHQKPQNCTIEARKDTLEALKGTVVKGGQEDDAAEKDDLGPEVVGSVPEQGPHRLDDLPGVHHVQEVSCPVLAGVNLKCKTPWTPESEVRKVSL